jgi:hypothetical protein
MDQNYIDIEGHVARARKLRNEAVGELISSGFRGLKQLWLTLQTRKMPLNTAVARRM